MNKEELTRLLADTKHSAENNGTIARNFYRLVNVCQSLLEEVEELGKQIDKKEAPAKDEEFKKGEVVIVTGLKYSGNYDLPCLGIVDEKFDMSGEALVKIVNRSQEIKCKVVGREHMQKLPVIE